jgi:hypothetical protein
MTYKEYFVVEVKSRGKILRVRDDQVFLPFGSEYSLLLKNLNSQRASVKISIDGEDVLDYQSLIIGPNETSEIEGFLRGNVARNRFKFIEKTQQISDHRGDRIDDGLIRVEFAFEKPKPEPIIRRVIEEHHHHYRHHHWPTFTIYEGEWPKYNSADNISYGGSTSSPSFSSTTMMSSGSLGVENEVQCYHSDAGITVKGSEIAQQFHYASIGELEESKVIVIHLRGEGSTGRQVETPITVSDKLTCRSCGIRSKSSFKFCPNCGTFLE